MERKDPSVNLPFWEDEQVTDNCMYEVDSFFRIPNPHDCLRPHVDIYSGANLVSDADVAGFIPRETSFLGNHKTISVQGI